MKIKRMNEIFFICSMAMMWIMGVFFGISYALRF